MEQTIVVRRQWNDWRRATYKIDHIGGLHFDNTSGGVQAVAPREFLHGYVFCDEMIDGELAHSCRHGPPPHRIKVCIVQCDNSKAVYQTMIREWKMDEERKSATRC